MLGSTSLAVAGDSRIRPQAATRTLTGVWPLEKFVFCQRGAPIISIACATWPELGRCPVGPANLPLSDSGRV